MGAAGPLTAMRSRYVHTRLSPEAMGPRSEYARIVLADEGASLPLRKAPDQFLLEALDAGIRMPASEICDYPGNGFGGCGAGIGISGAVAACGIQGYELHGE